MFREPARYYYNIGGRWSGKTYDTIQIVLYRLLMVPGSRACMMRKVYGSIKDTLFTDTLHILNKYELEYSKTVSPLYVRLPNGSDIIFKGADDPEKLKGLASVDIVLLDEANEFTEPDFETIDQSIRGKAQENSIYLCHNPVPKVPGGMFWFEKAFNVEATVGEHSRYYDEHLGAYVCTMRTTYRNNAECPDHVKRRLEGYKHTNPSLYKLWALGEYSEMEGVILSGWDVVSGPPDGADFIGYGLDFGFANDPAACIQIWGNKSEIWIKGIVYSTGLTNSDLYNMLVERKVENYDMIVADSAEPKSIEDLYRYGLRGIRGVKKKTNYKAEMANILQGMAIHVIDGDTDLQREISTWSWDEDKTGKILPRVKDGNDHYMDAMVMLMHEYRGPVEPIHFVRG